MKLISLIATSVVFFASMSAQAVLLPSGTFVPAQCGPQTQLNFVGPNVGEICLGSVVGEETRAVQFKMMEGDIRLYRVTNQSTLGIGKNHGTVMAVLTLTNEKGEQTSMKVLENNEGDITAVSGTLEDDAGYTVTNFHTVFTVQTL
jgi:hypothetical protein